MASLSSMSVDSGKFQFTKEGSQQLLRGYTASSKELGEFHTQLDQRVSQLKSEISSISTEEYTKFKQHYRSFQTIVQTIERIKSSLVTNFEPGDVSEGNKDLSSFMNQLHQLQTSMTTSLTGISALLNAISAHSREDKKDGKSEKEAKKIQFQDDHFITKPDVPDHMKRSGSMPKVASTSLLSWDEDIVFPEGEPRKSDILPLQRNPFSPVSPFPQGEAPVTPPLFDAVPDKPDLTGVADHRLQEPDKKSSSSSDKQSSSTEMEIDEDKIDREAKSPVPMKDDDDAVTDKPSDPPSSFISILPDNFTEGENPFLLNLGGPGYVSYYLTLPFRQTFGSSAKKTGDPD